MTTRLTIETFPNKAAADYIRGKAVADPENFGELPNQLKQRAFAVAGIERLDAVRRIRDAVAKLPEGADWDAAKKEIAAEISPFVGVATEDHPARENAAKARAEFLLRTHGFQAYAVSRHQQQMAASRARCGRTCWWWGRRWRPRPSSSARRIWWPTTARRSRTCRRRRR